MGDIKEYMARKPDPEKSKTSASGNKVFYSQLEANEKWAANNPRVMIGFRVTPEEKTQIDNYINAKAHEESAHIGQLPPEEQKTYKRKYSTDKGRPSVNLLLRYLLNKEMNGTLDGSNK